MDLRTVKKKRRGMLTLEGNIILTEEQNNTTTTQQTVVQSADKQPYYTAEHTYSILQFCKFLAEKSMRNHEQEGELEKDQENIANTINDKNETVDKITRIKSNNIAVKNKIIKRDVLLKIRQQIYERKRQRHLAQLLVKDRLSVWRPW